MSLENLKSALPDYAKDIRLNLGSLATEPALTDGAAGRHVHRRPRSRRATRR